MIPAEGNLQASVVFRKQLLFLWREVLWSMKFTKRDVQAFGSSYKDNTLILCLKKYTEVTVFDIVALRRNMTCSLNLFGIHLVFGVVRLYNTVYGMLESLIVVSQEISNCSTLTAQFCQTHYPNCCWLRSSKNLLAGGSSVSSS